MSINNFIDFDRTLIYYVDVLDYNIKNGIVEQYYLDVDNKNTIKVKHKIDNNVYETVTLKEDEYFLREFDVMEQQIILLKQFIANNQIPIFTLVNEQVEEGIAYLYNESLNIWDDDALVSTNLVYTDNNGVANLNYNYSYLHNYSLYYKINDIVYSTPVNNKNIYSGDLNNVYINRSDLVVVDYPEDYLNYKIHLINLPTSENNKQIRFLIKQYNYNTDYIAKTITQNIELSTTIDTYKFINYDFNENSLSYYIPNATNGYDLYMEIIDGDIIKTYKYSNKVSQFDIIQNFDFDLFVEVV